MDLPLNKVRIMFAVFEIRMFERIRSHVLQHFAAVYDGAQHVSIQAACARVKYPHNSVTVNAVVGLLAAGALSHKRFFPVARSGSKKVRHDACWQDYLSWQQPF